MTNSATSLAQRCRQTAGDANEAAEWLRNPGNLERVGRAGESLVKKMRRAARRAGQLEKAALRPMCVGIFGPSQAGKSYLVEVTARPEAGELRAKFNGAEPVDFLAEINP